MAKSDQIYLEALELAKSFDDNFVELASKLRTLHEGDSEKYRDFVKASGIDSRKAYYLIALDKAFSPLKISKKKLSSIGWTKLMIIQPHVTKDNVAALLKAASENTAAKLKRIVKGEDVVGNTHAVLMYFSPEQYSRLVDVLVENGAERSGRGLVDKEKAIMHLIESVKK